VLILRVDLRAALNLKFLRLTRGSTDRNSKFAAPDDAFSTCSFDMSSLFNRLLPPILVQRARSYLTRPVSQQSSSTTRAAFFSRALTKVSAASIDGNLQRDGRIAWMTAKRNRRKQTVSFDERLRTAAKDARQAAQVASARNSPRSSPREGKTGRGCKTNQRMADLGARATTMTVPGRREACLERARIFCEMAETDPVNRNYWSREARKWFDRAATPVGHVVVTVEATAVSSSITARERSSLSVPARSR
jgi:hypothetical protein